MGTYTLLYSKRIKMQRSSAMIKSMTGYGMGTAEGGGKVFTVEIKAVNSRYSDFSVKLPRIYSFLEEPLRKKAAERINRGKVDIYVNIENTGEADSVVNLNKPLAKAYLDALRELSADLGISSNASACDPKSMNSKVEVLSSIAIR